MNIVLDGISKTYAKNGSAGVRGIDLEIRDREFVTLMGPSGAGKSTLLGIVSGVLAPDGGRVLFDGRDVTRLPPEARPVHTVFQGLHLFPNMTVAGNVAFALEQARDRPARSEIQAAVARLLQRVGLGGYESRRVTELSGGERQRVAIARALIDHPQALLLDEPFAPLDRPLKESLIDLILSIKRESGITIVLTTHDWHEALRLSDRIAVLRRGALAQVGTPQDLYFKPKTPSIARITGPMNVLENFPRPGLWGIRPAHVIVGSGDLAGVVEEILFAGSAYQIRIRLERGTLIQTESASPLERGTAIRLDLPTDRLVALEPDVQAAQS